ncbi:Uncharacterized protein conserved in bacteria [Tatumella ptyseos]|uniref:Uncharacterized protein conserved in bacteria n=1 Tax=Tatumella ptyseos TaxID=82987 RepID=A0A2X5P811_9GAMM|nr:Uncharacterized protein conserved in bacteria [Tatumella ptyseos]
MRAGLLAGRLIASDGKPEDNASVMDYLLLQIFNKYQVILEHLRHTPKTPPVDFYQVLAQLAAEASTFVKTKVRRPLPAPEYDHASLYTSIRPLVDQVHDLLNQILVRAGEIIPLHAKGNGIWVASVLPAELNAFEGIVLAVHARLAPDILQHQFSPGSKSVRHSTFMNWCDHTCRGYRFRHYPCPRARSPTGRTMFILNCREKVISGGR